MDPEEYVQATTEARKRERDRRAVMTRDQMQAEAPGLLEGISEFKTTFGGLVLRSWSSAGKTTTDPWPGGNGPDPYFEGRQRWREAAPKVAGYTGRVKRRR